MIPFAYVNGSETQSSVPVAAFLCVVGRTSWERLRLGLAGRGRCHDQTFDVASFAPASKAESARSARQKLAVAVERGEILSIWEDVMSLRTARYLGAVLLFVPFAAQAQSDEEMIKSAEAAAPAAVSGKATIYAMDDTGQMKTLREGANGWWCMPDTPSSPGPDPMCGDANSMEWAMAWIGKTEPPKGKVGFMYMLAGGSDTSNTDPYATGPAEGNAWISTGPHVMVVNATDMMAGYPTSAVPDTSAPYVMWPGTPYAHLMIPVQ